MDIQDIDIEEIEDMEDLAVTRIPKRYIRDQNNIFEFYEDSEFKKCFRFCKESVLHGILPRIEQYLRKVNNRGLPIDPIVQLLVCLRFYASASFQIVVGDTMALSQPTISRIVFRVSALLASLISDVIKMPTTQERKNKNYQLFQALGYGNGAIGLPGIDGAIDCTHIRLTHTRFHGIDEVFRNRKGYFSLNIQTVIGPRMEFLDIVPEYPGSQHDSRIFKNSRIYMRYMQERLNGKLVGDSGYPALPFLLTPIENPQTDEEIMYNIIHGRTRQIVERTYSVWKRRFPCLSRGLGTKLLCSTTIVVACAVLHNLALMFHDELPEDNENDPRDEYEEVPINPPHWQPREGFAVREALIEDLFR
ncbi:putative nuclease HARBI1 [Harpegnathos saltator]|uniref:putative nuclease HARBI1 n=1 Tax=Harpegnathos saltator TaxID=610380 RepID=UPI00058D10B5|nr:putative nuclease HARBI1 [Harpegnathos saltator]